MRGKHDGDWRCPECGHWARRTSVVCRVCRTIRPGNGPISRKALRIREAEYRTMAILRKYGLTAERV